MSQQQDYSDGIVFLVVIFALLIFAFINWLEQYFIFPWYVMKAPFIWLFYHIPDNINNILFFWMEYLPPPMVIERVIDLNATIDVNYELFFGEGKGVVYMYDNYQDIPIDKIGREVSYMYLPYIIYPFIKLSSIIMKKITYTNSMTMEEFRNQESELWPTIKPALGHSNKVIDNLSSGEWSMATRPEVFFENEDFYVYVDENGKILESRRRKKKSFKFSINYEKMYEYYLNQLGEEWKGLDCLKEEEKYLLAVFLPKINRNGKKTLEMLDLFGRYYSNQKGKIHNKDRKAAKAKLDKMIPAVISEYYETELVQSTIKKHFYKQTVFSALLEKAREDGVLANGQFLWLKPLNRVLWYNMASIGRKLPFFEAAGIWSHYITEKAISSSISMPKIENAVRAADEYLLLKYDDYISFADLENIGKEE